MRCRACLTVVVWATGAAFTACGDEPDSSNGLDPQLDRRLTEAQQIYFRAEYDSAAVSFADVRAEAEQMGDARTVAATTMWMGLAAMKRGQWDTARILGEHAVDLQLEHGFSDLLPRAYNALGLLAWEDYRLADAESHYTRSIALAEAADMPYAVAIAKGNLGLVFQDLGDFEGARAAYMGQLEVSLALDSTRSVASSRLNLATLSIWEGDPLTAARALPGVVAQFAAMDDRWRLQVALARLAEAYADLGEPRLAFQSFDRALAIARENGFDLEVARHLDHLADLHQRVGNLSRALEFYDEARAELNARGLTVESGGNLRNSAAIRAKLGDVERARADALAASAIHAGAGLLVAQIDDQILLAEIAQIEEDATAVARHLDRATEIATEVEDAATDLRLELVRARFALENERPSRALAYLIGIEPDLEPSPTEVKAEGFGLLARAYTALGDFRSAAAAGARAVEAVERIRGHFGSAELRTTFLNERLDVYGDLVAALFRLGRSAEAFQVLDAARGRGVTAHIASAQSTSAPIAAVAERDQMLSLVSFLTTALDAATANPLMSPQALAAIRAELEEARRAYDNAYRDAREQLGADAPLLGLGDADLAEVQAALGPREALVEYLVSHDRVWTVVVTPGEIHPLSTPIASEELASRVRIARDLIASPDNDGSIIGPVMEALHELLLGPALRSGLLADVHLLTIVPHTVLNYLPFVALVDPATDRYLIEDFQVRYLPSAAALPVLAARAEAEAGPRASLFAPKDDELPQTRAEIDRIDQALGRTRRYVGRRATEARVRDALEGGGWVHLATHGVMNAQNPMFSRIELAAGRGDRSENDGRLEVHEVLDMNIRSELVFLSGCETGVGSAWATVEGRGEDHTTLERAFLYAGAANVIATLWPIDDGGAAELAGAFYEPRVSRATPAARLAEAQRTLLASSEWAAPYYWAGYRLSGTNRLAN